MSRRRATLTDVARLAGVHASTVSRALSRPHLVSDETRELVESAVDELDFRVNVAARTLLTGRTGAIGVLVPDIANPYFAEIVRAAQAEAALNDLVLLVADTEHESAHELRAFRTLQPHVDGVIVCTPVASGHSTASTPTVFVNRAVAGVCSVTTDQSVVVQLALDHLHRLGHRHVAWLNGPSSYWSAEQRGEVIAALDRRRKRHTVISNVEPTFDGGWKITEDVLQSGATAVVAFNDLMALGVLAAARSCGVDVPAELSVVGSDDIQAASMSWPSLTTVAIPFDRIGRIAVQSLLRLRERTTPAQHGRVPVVDDPRVDKPPDAPAT